MHPKGPGICQGTRILRCIITMMCPRKFMWIPRTKFCRPTLVFPSDTSPGIPQLPWNVPTAPRYPFPAVAGVKVLFRNPFFRRWAMMSSNSFSFLARAPLSTPNPLTSNPRSVDESFQRMPVIARMFCCFRLLFRLLFLFLFFFLLRHRRC